MYKNLFNHGIKNTYRSFATVPSQLTITKIVQILKKGNTLYWDG